MTPYELDILIWYHAHADDHPDYVRRPPIWDSTLERFLASGLLEVRTANCSNRDSVYVATDRCHAYVNDGLCAVPLPELRWEIPWAKNL